MAVEHEFILASHQPAEGDEREVVTRALGEHALALDALARVVGRSGDVHDQGRPGQRLLGGRRSGLPDVLAHRQPDAVRTDVQHSPGGAGLEVALLVEHTVVGQVHLAIDGVDGAVGKHRGGVVHVLGALGKADDRDRPARVRCQLLERCARAREEVLAQEQILGRVAGERQLGEQDQIGVRPAPGLVTGADQREVAVDVADGCVQLAQRQAHVSAPGPCSWAIRGCGRSPRYQ